MSSKKKQCIEYLAANPDATNGYLSGLLDCSERTVQRARQELKDSIETGNLAPKPYKKERILFSPDHHFPYHIESVWNIILDSAEEAKVDRIVLGGDVIDFMEISFWKTDPARMTLEEELVIIKEKLYELRNRFPDIPIDFIMGNHERRFIKYLWSNTPALSRLEETNLENILHLKDYNITLYDNVYRMTHGATPYNAGKLYFLHGDEARVSFNGVNIPRLYYLKTFVNTIMGHNHVCQEFTVKKMNGKVDGAWSVGCACKTSPEYQAISQHVNGYAIIDVYENGNFSVQNKKIINGMVV